MVREAVRVSSGYASASRGPTWSSGTLRGFIAQRPLERSVRGWCDHQDDALRQQLVTQARWNLAPN